MEASTKLLWKMMGLRCFADWCDFKSEKSKQFLYNFSNHHIGFDFLYIILQTVSREIAYEFIKCYKTTEKKVPKYKDLLEWINNDETRNINLVQFHSLVNGPLLSVCFLRSAIRCNNLLSSVELIFM